MFKLIKKNKKSKLRKGILKVGHGKIKTPVFMPDATRGNVKLIRAEEVMDLGVQSMVVNTFHLYLQPGVDVISKFKGINDFINWPGPLLSDSGGYQVFSLIHRGNKGSRSKMGEISDKGVIFKSPVDGSKHILTPEKSIKIQFDLGVDIMVCLDDCPPNNSSRKDLERSVERTISWARRCRKEYNKKIKDKKLKIYNYNRPLLFGVIQGGKDLDLRRRCAEELIKLDFDGYGFGARPVDENGIFMEGILQQTADLIPDDKLRFALGIGNPEHILRCAHMGWDMFDCVIPTREARHGRLYVKRQDTRYLPTGTAGKKQISPKIQDTIYKKFPISNFKFPKFYSIVNINNSKYKNSFEPVAHDCDCELCQSYSAGYLHHLFKIKEPLGQRLATMHNLKFYMDLMDDIRNT